MDIQIVYENEFFENDEEGYLFTRRGEPARMRVWHARALALRALSGRRGLKPRPMVTLPGGLAYGLFSYR